MRELKIVEGRYQFDPPIKYELDFYTESDPKSPDLPSEIVYITLDNGMEIKFNLDCFICADLKTNEEKAVRLLEFEFAHAFGHIPEDPNYTYLNWALVGWYRDNYKGEIEDCDEI